MNALTQENFIRTMRIGPLRDVVSGICLLLMLFEPTGMQTACTSGFLFSKPISGPVVTSESWTYENGGSVASVTDSQAG